MGDLPTYLPTYLFTHTYTLNLFLYSVAMLLSFHCHAPHKGRRHQGGSPTYICIQISKTRKSRLNICSARASKSGHHSARTCFARRALKRPRVPGCATDEATSTRPGQRSSDAARCSSKLWKMHKLLPTTHSWRAANPDRLSLEKG